jgi:ABC-type transporter Mla maintaining outer membrane lipid asymmetry permease subunit MlaE
MSTSVHETVPLAGFGRCALLLLACLRALRQPGLWLGETVAEMRRQAFDALPLVLLLSTLAGALISQQTVHGSVSAFAAGRGARRSITPRLMANRPQRGHVLPLCPAL